MTHKSCFLFHFLFFPISTLNSHPPLTVCSLSASAFNGLLKSFFEIQGKEEAHPFSRLIPGSVSLVGTFCRPSLFLNLRQEGQDLGFRVSVPPVPFELPVLISSINNLPPSPAAGAAPTLARLRFSSHSSLVLQSCWTPGRADHQLSGW